MVDIEALSRAREQLFAEAVAKFKSDATWWEMPAEETKAEQESRYTEDPWTVLIDEYIRPKSTVTVSEILLDCLRFEKANIGRQDQMRVASCLRRLAWEKGQKARRGTDVTPIWRPKA
jgi:putative DNA primase/helicase